MVPGRSGPKVRWFRWDVGDECAGLAGGCPERFCAFASGACIGGSWSAWLVVSGVSEGFKRDWGIDMGIDEDRNLVQRFERQV